MSKTTRRVLSLDGGGTRGISTIEYLKRIEQNIAPAKLHEYFDLIVGTSTGALLAVCIAYLKYDSNQCEKFYFDFASNIFPYNAVSRASSKGEVGDSDTIKELLRSFLGDTKLTDISHPKVVITSTCQQKIFNELYLFRNYETESIYKGTCNALVLNAALASTAAPIYLKQKIIDGIPFVDGGLEANNPTFVAFCQCRRIWPDDQILLLSLGTGRRKNGLNKIKSRSISEVASITISNALHDVTSADKTHGQVLEVLRSSKDTSTTYIRLQLVLEDKDYTSLNDTNVTKLKKLQELTRQYIRSDDPEVQTFNNYQWL